ncbi:MAG: hypothetical protein E7G62_21735, partial [Klebsiella grimontii]|nr:hypothetical protein [Klebsiella grimontii]
SELLLCHGMVCVVGRMRDLILQLSKSSIYSTKPQKGSIPSLLPALSKEKQPPGLIFLRKRQIMSKACKEITPPN